MQNGRCYTNKQQNEEISIDNSNTDHEVLERAVFPPPPAVDSQQGCCCRCACSDCTLQLLTPFLHMTGQQRTCQGKHISGGEKKSNLYFITV